MASSPIALRANQAYSAIKGVTGHAQPLLMTALIWPYLFLFPAGFSSGNRFTSFIYNVTNISNIHLWMFDNQDVGGSSGIWYTQWEHWQMDFALKVEPCPNCTSPDCGGKTCYFGTCGIDGECQCLSGYSGSNCSTSKSSLWPELIYYWHISLKPCSFMLEEKSHRLLTILHVIGIQNRALPKTKSISCFHNIASQLGIA